MADILGPSEQNARTEAVVARYRWTEDELLTAYRSHYRYSSTQFVRSVVIVLCAVALIGGTIAFFIAIVMAPSKAADIAFLPIFFGVMLALAWISRSLTVSRYSVRRQFRKRPDQDIDIEWWLGPDEIRTRSELNEARFVWSAFVKAVKTPNGLLLYNLTNFFQWLPRHAFSSDADFEQVVAWAELNVPVSRRR